MGKKMFNNIMSNESIEKLGTKDFIFPKNK